MSAGGLAFMNGRPLAGRQTPVAVVGWAGRLAIFGHLMSVDAAGMAHQGEAALKRLYAAANAPMFTYDGSYFGTGEIVGGPMHSVAATARGAADAAMRILGGEKAGDVKTPGIPFATPVYDWRLLQRWAIPESRLPPGSEVRFRIPTVWEQYQGTFTGIIALLLLQTGLIAWLVYEHGRRRRLEAQSHAMSGQLISAQEEERSRLARELHDDITQRLAALAINTSIEERKVASPAAAVLRSVREGLMKLGEDVHALSYRLHPSTLMDLGLREAMKSEGDRFSRVSALKLELDVDEVPDAVPPDVALCLFRIAQESLRNIDRHASASRAKIRLRRQDGGLQLTVHDNGMGFDAAKARKASLGLAGMRQRIGLLGGKLKIDSKPGLGTLISAWVPLAPAGRKSPGHAERIQNV
jgi:signal transduction histidine kinase